VFASIVDPVGAGFAERAPSTRARALLAKQMIEMAQKGERNIDRLVDDGVAYLQGVK
jgi:hypothetical protein